MSMIDNEVNFPFRDEPTEDGLVYNIVDGGEIAVPNAHSDGVDTAHGVKYAVIGSDDPEAPMTLHVRGGPGDRAQSPDALRAHNVDRANPDLRVALFDPQGVDKSTPHYGEQDEGGRVVRPTTLDTLNAITAYLSYLEREHDLSAVHLSGRSAGTTMIDAFLIERARCFPNIHSDIRRPEVQIGNVQYAASTYADREGYVDSLSPDGSLAEEDKVPVTLQKVLDFVGENAGDNTTGEGVLEHLNHAVLNGAQHEKETAALLYGLLRFQAASYARGRDLLVPEQDLAGLTVSEIHAAYYDVGSLLVGYPVIAYGSRAIIHAYHGGHLGELEQGPIQPDDTQNYILRHAGLIGSQVTGRLVHITGTDDLVTPSKLTADLVEAKGEKAEQISVEDAGHGLNTGTMGTIKDSSQELFT